MSSNLSFKAKILATLITIIIATVLTSYFSINHYVSSYIIESDERNINAQLTLVRDKLAQDINTSVVLAENLKIGLTGLDTIKENSGFYSVVKVVSDLVITDKGRVNNDSIAKRFIDQVAQAKQVTISNVFFQNDIPLLSITIPRGNSSGDIFYIDMRSVQELLSLSAIQGSYIELYDPANNLVYSDKVEGDLIALNHDLMIDGKEWGLTGYLDKGYVQSNTNRLSKSITFALLIVSLITIPTSVFIISRTFRHLSSLRNIVTDLSQGNGDLTRRLTVYSQDDLGKIAQGINNFITNLQRMMLDVSQSNQKIHHEIHELTNKADSNQQLLDAHAQETEKVVTAINEMSATAESVAETGSRAAEFTQLTNNEAEKSKEVVQQATESVSHLAREVDDMSSSIVTMSKDFEKIDAVLRVIGEIAEQTNLLALNAAIEAARAGDQGRGFAVVADEVRALAARTQQSTAEVDVMLANLRKATGIVVNSMDATKVSCTQTVDNTSRVMDSLNSMTTSITTINELTTQMASSAKEQSIVTEEVNENMMAIHDMIRQLSNNATGTVKSTQRLIEANSELNTVVGSFKLS
ncbi:MAG: methyl-accepting chemotaxis protein [Photobacterium frigidiphilum]|uniref:methyl-accepting chemotaxis protein n=1 Tax=Photobacterium frigidiphilum TaxID=264736 RepID=UPI0030012011